MLLVPRLDLGIPRRLVTETRVAVDPLQRVPVRQLTPCLADLAARDSATPLGRIPDGRPTIRPIPRGEDQPFDGLQFDRGPIFILGPVLIEASAHLCPVWGVWHPRGVRLAHVASPPRCIHDGMRSSRRSFFWMLQRRWASATFDMLCAPPAASGMTWSRLPLRGAGLVAFPSTTRPQIQHFPSSRSQTTSKSIGPTSAPCLRARRRRWASSRRSGLRRLQSRAAARSRSPLVSYQSACWQVVEQYRASTRAEMCKPTPHREHERPPNFCALSERLALAAARDRHMAEQNEFPMRLPGANKSPQPPQVRW